MPGKTYTVRADSALDATIKKAQNKLKLKTPKNVSVNDMFIDAIVAYCKGVLESNNKLNKSTTN
jgi:hypothetical protein